MIDEIVLTEGVLVSLHSKATETRAGLVFCAWHPVRREEY